MSKRVACLAYGCAERRVHWARPDVPRGTQYVEVPDEYEGPAYCSLTCAILSGALSARYEPPATGVEGGHA